MSDSAGCPSAGCDLAGCPQVLLKNIAYIGCLKNIFCLALSVPTSLSLSSLCLVNVIFEFLSRERGEGAYLICHFLHARILSHENSTL